MYKIKDNYYLNTKQDIEELRNALYIENDDDDLYVNIKKEYVKNIYNRFLDNTKYIIYKEINDFRDGAKEYRISDLQRNINNLLIDFEIIQDWIDIEQGEGIYDNSIDYSKTQLLSLLQSIDEELEEMNSLMVV